LPEAASDNRQKVLEAIGRFEAEGSIARTETDRRIFLIVYDGDLLVDVPDIAFDNRFSFTIEVIPDNTVIVSQSHRSFKALGKTVGFVLRNLFANYDVWENTAISGRLKPDVTIEDVIATVQREF